MKRWLFGALLLAGCSSSPSGNDAGNDAGTDAGSFTSNPFDVSGTAFIYPPAAAFLSDAGLSETVVGLTARVEEPFKVALGTGGIFSAQILDANAGFSASSINPDQIVLGVGAGLFDDAGLPDGGYRVVRSATTIYDVALQDGDKPMTNITGAKAYAIPTAFHDQLVRAITPAKIQQLTSGAPNGSVSTLIAAGCMLGQVVDATGAPVAGVTLEPNPSSLTANFFYPTADLSTVGSATSSNGLFVYVHNGGSVSPFRFDVTGHSEYKQRNAGATPDACLVPSSVSWDVGTLKVRVQSGRSQRAAEPWVLVRRAAQAQQTLDPRDA